MFSFAPPPREGPFSRRPILQTALQVDGTRAALCSGLKDSGSVKNYFGGLHQSTEASMKVTCDSNSHTGLPPALGSTVMWLPVTEPLLTPLSFSAVQYSSFSSLQREIREGSDFQASDALQEEKGQGINYAS